MTPREYLKTVNSSKYKRLMKNPELITEITQTEEACKIAVAINGWLIDKIEIQTQEICDLAVKQDAWAFSFIDSKFRSLELSKIAVIRNGNELENVPDKHRTDELIKLAIKSNPYCIQFLKNPKVKYQLLAIEKNSNVISVIKSQKEDVILYAIKTAYKSDELGDKTTLFTPKICKALIEKSPYELKNISKENQNPEICLEALKKDKKSLKHVKICNNSDFKECVIELKKMLIKQKLKEII